MRGRHSGACLHIHFKAKLRLLAVALSATWDQDQVQPNQDCHLYPHNAPKWRQSGVHFVAKDVTFRDAVCYAM